ncbi:MAG: hypothetical protein RLZZ517_679 [Candidatus Parcubacteria bacterium]|jgi:hypothetical protein
MNPNALPCKNCGHRKSDHQELPSPPKCDEIKDGYTLSLLECVQGEGFQSKELPSSNPD